LHNMELGDVYYYIDSDMMRVAEELYEECHDLQGRHRNDYFNDVSLCVRRLRPDRGKFRRHWWGLFGYNIL
jgi:hypothetical protein